MNAFEPLLWMGVAYVVILIAHGRPPVLWLLAGLLVGVGLLNKHAMAFFAAALGAGVLASPQRRILRSRWLVAAAALALVIVAPHVWWQVEHGWPTLELLANARRFQHQPVTPLEFIWGQIQIVQPVTLPLWIAGVYFLLFDRRGAQVRFLGWTFLFLFVVFLLMQAKTYYLAPIYPMLFAAGALVVSRAAARPGRAWIAVTAFVLLAFGGVVTAPYALPLLPLERLPTYLEWLGIKEVRPETRRMGNVPQLFADMLGWDELAAEVARVYWSLPPEDRERAVLWGSYYGPAGAIDYLGRAHGLPHAISGHQNYYLWGSGDASGEVMIAVEFDSRDLTPWFDSVTPVAELHCDYCMPDRAVQRIYVCRGLKLPLREFWPLTKCWTCDRPQFQSPSDP
jgi:hypothetical protein